MSLRDLTEKSKTLLRKLKCVCPIFPPFLRAEIDLVLEVFFGSDARGTRAWVSITRFAKASLLCDPLVTAVVFSALQGVQAKSAVLYCWFYQAHCQMQNSVVDSIMKRWLCEKRQRITCLMCRVTRLDVDHDFLSTIFVWLARHFSKK